jgi:hypothetical protein
MSETTPMTAERFKTLLEAYGADVGRWPQAERLSAHDYAQTAPEAVALLAEARAIDALLAKLPAPEPRPALMTSILAQIHRRPARQRGAGAALTGLLDALWPRAAAWKPASVFVSALVLGVILGGDLFGTAETVTASSSSEDVLAYAVPSLMQDLN